MTVDQLMKIYKTMSKIRKASEKELADLVGEAKARLIKNYFIQKKED